VDFAMADSAQNLQDGINTPDMISIPFAAQALVLVYNLPGIADGSLTLSMEVTARIMLGNITSWKDPSIVALNPGVALPHTNVLSHSISYYVLAV
jgi:phosphate transport system substrate-binding protein